MIYTHNYNQPSLLGFSFFGFNIKNTELVQLCQQINWNELIEIVSKAYSHKTGRNSKSIRVMIALEMLKVYYKDPSDEMLVGMLRTDASVMYFCGYDSPPSDKEIPDSSSLTKFRNRLTPEILEEITDALLKEQIKKLPPKKRKQLSGDTTALPANVTQPTDTKLMFTASKKLKGMAKSVGLKAVAGWKIVEKSYSKFRKHKKKAVGEIRKMKEKLLDYGKRQIAEIGKVFSKLSTTQGRLAVILQEVLRQQEEMLLKGTKNVKDRIVSIHEADIRPIVRGKAGKRVEFGKKLAVMVIGQKLICPTKCEYDAYADQGCVKEDIERYEKIVGKKPGEYSYDRGGHSPGNHEYLERSGIVDGIGYMGKSPPKQHSSIPRTTAKRMYGQRQSTEMRIGVLKTRWGCNRIPYKSANTEVRVTFGCMMNNLKAMM